MSLSARRRRRVARATPDLLLAYVRARAEHSVPPLDCYWIKGANETFPEPTGIDERTSFCRECCEAKVAELRTKYPKRTKEVGVRVAGGYGNYDDSTAFCHTCLAKLDTSLTDCGAEEERRALTHECAPSFDDVEGWRCLADALENFEAGDVSLFALTADDIPEAGLHEDWLGDWLAILHVVRRAQREQATARSAERVSTRAKE